MVVLHDHIDRAADRLTAGRTSHLERRVLALSRGDVASTDANGAVLAPGDRAVLNEDDLEGTSHHGLTERDGVAVGVSEVEVREHRVVADEDVLRTLAGHAGRVVLRGRASLHSDHEALGLVRRNQQRNTVVRSRRLVGEGERHLAIGCYRLRVDLASVRNLGRVAHVVGIGNGDRDVLGLTWLDARHRSDVDAGCFVDRRRRGRRCVVTPCLCLTGHLKIDLGDDLTACRDLVVHLDLRRVHGASLDASERPSLDGDRGADVHADVAGDRGLRLAHLHTVVVLHRVGRRRATLARLDRLLTAVGQVVLDGHLDSNAREALGWVLGPTRNTPHAVVAGLLEHLLAEPLLVAEDVVTRRHLPADHRSLASCGVNNLVPDPGTDLDAPALADLGLWDGTHRDVQDHLDARRRLERRLGGKRAVDRESGRAVVVTGQDHLGVFDLVVGRLVAGRGGLRHDDLRVVDRVGGLG